LKTIAIRPFRPVNAGGSLGVTAPASPPSAPNSARLLKSLAVLHQAGFKAAEPEIRRGPFSYLAGPDAGRASSLQRLMTDPSIDGVICLRGGYGSARMAEHLNFRKLAMVGKPLIGFSDVTVLLSGLLRAGLASIHGPNLLGLSSQTEKSRRRLLDLIAGGWADSEPLRGEVIRTSSYRADGILLGGNLTRLAGLMGTRLRPPSNGAIVFLEDIQEKADRLDRCLTQLLAAGFFKNAVGIILGQLTKSDDEASLDENTAQKVALDRLGPLCLPVLANFPFGHGPENLALVVGAPARIDQTTGRLIPGPWPKNQQSRAKPAGSVRLLSK
jgi:muramoyltetrapeptide carboxypeptidase